MSNCNQEQTFECYQEIIPCESPAYQSDNCEIKIKSDCIEHDLDGDCLTITSDDTLKQALQKIITAICDLELNGGDVKFKISNTDTTAGNFLTKVVPGQNIVFTKLNSGGDERLVISLSDAFNSNVNLLLGSSNNTINITQTGLANHTANLTVKISEVEGNAITLNNGLYVPQYSYRVKIQDSGTPGYLNDKIYGSTGNDDIIILNKIINNDKMYLQPDIDIMALLNTIQNDSELLSKFCTVVGSCETIPECTTAIQNVSINTDSFGISTATVTITGAVPAGYYYAINSLPQYYSLHNPIVLGNFTTLGLSGTIDITIVPKCTNGALGNPYTLEYSIPTPECTTTITNLIYTDTIVNYIKNVTVSVDNTFKYLIYYIDADYSNPRISYNTTFSVNFLSSGNHILEVKAVCTNDIEGDLYSSELTIAEAECNILISNISATTSNSSSNIGNIYASFVPSSSALLYEYKLDSGSIFTTTNTTIVMSGVAAGSYVLYIRAKCSNGTYVAWSSINVSIPVIEDCSTPIITGLTANGNNEIIVEWTDVTSYTAMIVEYTTDGGTTWVSRSGSPISTRNLGRMNITGDITVRLKALCNDSYTAYSSSLTLSYEALAIASFVSACSLNPVFYLEPPATEVARGIALYADPALTTYLTGVTKVYDSAGYEFNYSSVSHLVGTPTGLACLD